MLDDLYRVGPFALAALAALLGVLMIVGYVAPAALDALTGPTCHGPRGECIVRP